MKTPKDHPLAWPPGQARTPATERRESKFRVTFAKAYNDLFGLCEKLHQGEREFVISTNVPLGKRGLPLLAEVDKVTDPGACAYVWRGGKPFHFACDTYVDARSNLRAVTERIATFFKEDKVRRHGVHCGAYAETPSPVIGGEQSHGALPSTSTRDGA